MVLTWVAAPGHPQPATHVHEVRPMRIDGTDYTVLRCVQIVGRRREYLTLDGGHGHAVATGRSRGELLGDFRRRQLETEAAEAAAAAEGPAGLPADPDDLFTAAEHTAHARALTDMLRRRRAAEAASWDLVLP